MQMREKVGMSRNAVFFHSGGSKSRLAKAAGAEPSAQMREEKLHAVVARRKLRSQITQNAPGSATFGGGDEGKSADAVARSAFQSPKVESTLGGSDRFSTLRYGKSARRCGVRHISKSKCTVLRGRRKELSTLSKASKTSGLHSISTNDRRRGAFEEDLARCIFCGRRSTRHMFIRDVRRSGR